MKPTDLRGILQYIPRFRGKVFILAIDGAVVADENFANLLLDVAVLRSLNIRVVIVHGASALISKLGREQGIEPSNLDGSGITDAATLRLAIAASNHLTHKVLEGLSVNDLRAVAPNAVVAHPMGIIDGEDRQLTGKVERVDVDFLKKLLEDGIIPVLPPLGFDGEGNTYRVNSDGVALALGEALKAAKLIFVTAVDGLRYNGEVIRQVLVADLEKKVNTDRNRFAPETVSKAIHAVAACKAGVPRVHVINGQVDEGLLAEVFSNEGVGTLIYANEYQHIRRALKKDVRHIQHLIKQAMATAELVKRTRASIEKHIGDYYIFEFDKNPVACIALHAFPEEGKGELACLYVSSSHENQGIGRKLVAFAEEKARQAGLKQLIALSTQAFTYFQSKAGFVEGTPDALPPARRGRYDQSGRRSKILVKELT